jgi:hypothetical protein
MLARVTLMAKAAGGESPGKVARLTKIEAVKK